MFGPEYGYEVEDSKASKRQPMDDSEPHDDGGSGEEREEQPVLSAGKRAPEGVPEDIGSIYIRAEIEGPGDEVVARLSQSDGPKLEYEELADVIADLTAVIRTVERLDGGIRSTIARETDIGASDETIRHMLETLREYGLVELDRNTWRRGTAPDESDE